MKERGIKIKMKATSERLDTTLIIDYQRLKNDLNTVLKKHGLIPRGTEIIQNVKIEV